MNSRADGRLEVSFVVLVIGGSFEDWQRLGRALEGQTNVATIVTWGHAITDVPRLCERFRAFSGIAGSVVEPGAALVPCALNFLPPGAPVELCGDGFAFNDATRTSSLDLLSSSLARDYGERSLALLLEEPLDGYDGLFVLRGSGGLVIATAEDDSAPDEHTDQRRIAVADRRVSAATFAEEIADLVAEVSSRTGAISVTDAALDSLVVLARARSGRDIGVYDRGFLAARLRRRMNVCRVSAVEEYTDRFDRDDDERRSFLSDLRTRRATLFGNDQCWTILAERVITELVERAGDQSLRLWVPGCGTGEHACALAILVHEAMDTAAKNLRVQIFASDSDPELIRAARERRFSTTEVETLPSGRLRDSFVAADDGEYRLAKRLQDTLVFAVQEVHGDPPYPRIDLIAAFDLFDHLSLEIRGELSCGFHSALVPDGTLLLTDAAALPEPSSFFARTALPGVLRAREVPKRFPSSYRSRAKDAALRSSPEAPNAATRQQIEQLLLTDHTPPAVVVDERFDVLYFFGHTRRYLQSPAGLATMNLLDVCPLELRSELRFLLQTAMKTGQVVSCQGMRMHAGELARMLNVTVRPVPNEVSQTDLLVIFEEDGTQESPAPLSQTRLRAAKVQDFETAALRQTREDFHSIVSASESAQEQLGPSKQELLLTNAELQVTNAQLERTLAASDLAIFLRQGLELVRKATGAELCDVIKLNDDRTALDRITAIGLESEVARIEPFIGDGAFAILPEREPIVLRPGSACWPAHLTEAGVQSGARVTIWARDDEPFGSLGVYSRTARNFSTQELVLLQTIANFFASAIERKLL